MTGQLCGRCGTALAPEGCPCGWSGSNEETAVIPVIGGPELVRPYFRPDDSELDDPDLDLDGDLDADLDDIEIVDAELLDVPGHRPMSAAAAGAGAGGAGAGGAGAGATRVLPAYLPVRRPVEPLGSVVVTRPTPGGPAAGRGRRQPRNSRSTVLIAAGIVLIAGIGVAAALVPKMLGGGQVNIAQPQPEITAPLPSQGPTSGSAQPSATATSSATRSVPVTQPTRAAATSARPTIAPTTAQPTATAGGPADGTPSSASASASASADPSGSAASGSLSLGDTGPAVATLQQDLATLWIDPGLQDNGDYNQQTEKDVATFQYWYGVQGDPTGVYGPNSQSRMAKLMRHQNGGDNG